jgi:hypothetical protein
MFPGTAYTGISDDRTAAFHRRTPPLGGRESWWKALPAMPIN